MRNPLICEYCGKPGRDGICDDCCFAEDIRIHAPSPLPPGRNDMRDEDGDPSMRCEEEEEQPEPGGATLLTLDYVRSLECRLETLQAQVDRIEAWAGRQ